jgi:DNA-binding transcriptional LysR family regulator
VVDQPFVGLHVNSQLNLQLTRAANELNRAWSCRVNVTSYDALVHMVEAGLGIGVLPCSLGRAYAKGIRIKLIGLDEAWAERSLVLATRSFETLAPAPKLLVDHLLADVPADPDDHSTNEIDRARRPGSR